MSEAELRYPTVDEIERWCDRNGHGFKRRLLELDKPREYDIVVRYKLAGHNRTVLVMGAGLSVRQVKAVALAAMDISFILPLPKLEGLEEILPEKEGT